MNLDKPLFSIIIPVYNQEKFIGHAIQSVINQTYSSWEIIVVDNHSTDNTLREITGFADPRIKLLTVENYGVIAKSRNKALHEAKGVYAAFLDSDDIWYPNKLEKTLSKLQGGIDFLYHDMTLIDSFGARQGSIQSRPIREDSFRDLLIAGNPIVNSSVTLRIELLQHIGWLDESPSLIGVEDYNAWLRIAHGGIYLCHLPEELGAYRIHGGSVSSINSHQGVPWRAFKGVEFDINAQLKLEIESKYWEINAKTSLRSGEYSNSYQSFRLAASKSSPCRKVKLLIYSVLVGILSKI